MRSGLVVALVCLGGVGSQGAEHGWWNAGWRYRTTVTRPGPYRDAGPRPVEAAIDFDRLLGEAGRLDRASVRVVEPTAAGPREVPFAWRDGCPAWIADGRAGQAGQFDVYFDTVDRPHPAPVYGADQLPPENLVANGSFEEADGALPRAWAVRPAELVSLATSGRTTGRQSLKITVDEHTAAEAPREVELAQSIDVRRWAGREMLFQCDLLAERAAYGAPVSIELQQFRADGSQIPEFAVEPRWLTIELAPGQPVHFSQRGRFNPQAATVNLCVRLRCAVTEEDSGKRVTGPESHFTVWLDRFVIRQAERWPWPGVNAERFVPGAIASAPLNRGFAFTGMRRLVFCGGSEGTLTSNGFNPDPRADHWGPQRGTLEFWCQPGWNADDGVEHVFLEGVAIGHRLQSVLRKTGASEGNQLEFGIADSAAKLHRVRAEAPLAKGRWHHVAATWDLPAGRLQLFVDGRRVAVKDAGGAAWPSSPVAEGPKELLGMGIVDEDKRSIPMQAYVGGDRVCRAARSAEAVLDEFRVSDVVRYESDFAPPRAELPADESTRALFHFENEANGLHAGDDQFVRGHLVSELPPLAEQAALEVLDAGRAVRRTVRVAPHARVEEFEANRAEKRLTVSRPVATPPDPAHVEHVAARFNVAGRGEQSVLVKGDWDPLMERVSYELRPGVLRARLPLVRANNNVVPASAQSLAQTLAPAGEDVQRAMEAFRYALEVTNYYDANYCETLPNGRNRRTAYTLTKALNCYPFNQCGPLNGTLRKLFLCVGVSSNDTSGTHHQFQQAYYQGDWRLFDLSPRVFWLERDNRSIAGRRDIEEDPYLKVRQGDKIMPWLPGRKGRARFGSAVRPHSMDFEIRAGETVDVCWHNCGKWFELTGNRQPLPLAKIPPFFGNGSITFQDTIDSPAVTVENVAGRRRDAPDRPRGALQIRAADRTRPAWIVYRVRCPWTIADAKVLALTPEGKPAGLRVSLSFDEGQHWTAARAAGLGPLVAGRYAYDLKLEIPAASGLCVETLAVTTEFVTAPLSMPGRLRLGANRVELYGGDPGDFDVVLSCTERHRRPVGLHSSAISYYLDGDQAYHRLLVGPPGGNARLSVATEGANELPTIRVEPGGAPPLGDRLPVDLHRSVRAAKGDFLLPIPGGLKEGDLHRGRIEIAGGQNRASAALVVLVAEAALAAEAERAEERSDQVADVERAELSGGRAAVFRGRGTLVYACQAPREADYAVWLRARWEPDASTEFSMTIDEQPARRIRAEAMIGFTDWTDPRAAHTKMFAHYGEQFGHWSWYRIGGVHLTAGKHRLTLGAGAGAWFDALVVLPATPEVDRSAMNLFQNWNFQP